MKVEKTADGVRLRESAADRFASLLIVGLLGLVFTGVGVSLLMVGAPLWVLLFLVVGVVCLAIAGVSGSRALLAGPAEVYLDRFPLRLGESVTVRYFQKRRGKGPVNGIVARLQCRELVTYRQGTNTRTDSATVWEAELPTAPTNPVNMPSLLHEAWRLRVPADRPPSFEANRNSIIWELKVNVDIPHGLDIGGYFRLPVLPHVIATSGDPRDQSAH